ncbi:MAG: hypothetical protein AAFN59_07485 [Pseudomonadota bacterium]
MIARASIAVAAFAGPASALTLADCEHAVLWNGQEYAHTDHSGGLVEWTLSWASEGVFDDLSVQDCATGEGMTIRARSERMESEIPYDRRDAVRKLVDLAVQEPVFFSAATLKDQVTDLRVMVTPLDKSEQSCACAAAYPELRGSKTPYEARQ